MDVNGTRFHLVVGPDGWLGTDVEVEPAGDLEYDERDATLRLRAEPFVVPPRAGNRRVSPDDRRGADRDAFGHTYWIGPDHRHVLVAWADGDGAERYWPAVPRARPADGDFAARARPSPPPPARLAGLAVTDDHHLLVGVPDRPGLLVFDLHAGGPPVARGLPAPVDVVDVAAVPGGGAWVLDRGSGRGPRLWALDPGLALRDLQATGPAPTPPTDFSPKDPDTEPPDVAPRATPTPRAVDAVDPAAVVALPDRAALVLDRGGPGTDPRLLRVPLDGGEVTSLDLPATDGGAPVDIAFLPGRGGGVAGEVYVADEQGDQATVLALDPDGTSLTRLLRYVPMRLFSGKGLVVGGTSVLHDLGDRWIRLVERCAPRFRPVATVTLAAMDSGREGTVWHRVALDGRIPDRCAVTVRSRTADDPAALDDAPWATEPAPVRRDRSELPHHRFGGDVPADGTHELLLQAAVGRLLQLRLDLVGDGGRTPALWALRAHEPRFSYVEHYLPDVYREDADSADFLSRYLANVEGEMTTIEGRVAKAQRLLDPTTVDVDHLPWLASWVGAVVDPSWDEARVRLFLAHAVELHARRGTPRGLAEAVRLAIDPCPDPSIFSDSRRRTFGVRIVETFRSRGTPAPTGDARRRPTREEQAPRWVAADGRAALDARWVQFLAARHGGPDAVERAWQRPVRRRGATLREELLPLTPSAGVEATDRADFLARHVAGTYADVGPGDAGAWQRFLLARHGDARRLSHAWGLVGDGRVAAVADVGVPTTRLPGDGAPLRDWMAFVGDVLPRRRAAHRFEVLVPAFLDETDEDRSARLRQVERVVAHEKPAHTLASVRPYWAAFRVGEARVGFETVPGEGSRFVAIALGHGVLARGHVTRRGPTRADRRTIVGAHRVTEDHTDE